MVAAVELKVQTEASVAGVSRSGASGQGSGVTVASDPDGPVMPKSTVPAGGLLMPLAVSRTVTVQLAGLLAGVLAGQSTVVEVPRAVTLMVSLPLLLACSESEVGRASRREG